MKLSIRNVRGIDNGEISLSPMALVGGKNGSGKTSIATAMAACLMQTPAPMPGMTKKDARELLRDTAQRGSARLAANDNDGEVVVNWPGGSVTANDNAPHASPIACGMSSPATMSARERSAFFIYALQATPTREDLAAAMAEHDINEQTVDAVWKSITDNGWDASHKRAQESGAKAKGVWEHITGEKYGARKGDDWKPAAFADIDVMPEAEDLEAAVAEKREAVEAAISQQAVSSDWLERQKATASTLADYTAKREQLQVQLDELNQQRHTAGNKAQAAEGEAYTAAEAVGALPRPGQMPDTVPCPECGAHLVVQSRTVLLKPEEGGPDDAENARRQKAINEAQAAADKARAEADKLAAGVRQLDADMQTVRRGIGDADAGIKAATDAAAAVDEAKTGGASADDVAAARQALEAAEHDLAALGQWHDALSKHQAIIRNQHIVAILAPDGLRQTVLADRLSELNDNLAVLCDVADWPRVTVEEGLSVALAGRDYGQLSGGEQFRVRSILQLLFAGMDGSAAVVVDAADILDKPGRNGLFSVIASTGIPALVNMTMNAESDVPDLAKAGLGASYWVAGGGIQQLGS